MTCHPLCVAGGILLAVYTSSVWPMMLDRLTTCPPVRMLLIAAFVWLVEILFSVWTVAYNFVPGGVYTREHTGWLIAGVMVMLGLATVFGTLLCIISVHRLGGPYGPCWAKLNQGYILSSKFQILMFAKRWLHVNCKIKH